MKISRPNRITRSYTQSLVAPPEKVMPLLCPVMEAEWIDGWDPVLVLSDSGVVEPGCVFVTDAEPDDAVWFVTEHNASAGRVEMVKITPGVTACKLTIDVRPNGQGSDADVCYSYTSLSPVGDAFVAAFTEEHYLQSMQEWEARINHYLQHGQMLKS